MDSKFKSELCDTSVLATIRSFGELGAITGAVGTVTGPGVVDSMGSFRAVLKAVDTRSSSEFDSRALVDMESRLVAS